MNEFEELKTLLRELAKKDIELLKEAWRDCISQGYFKKFPKICQKSFSTNLTIDDYEEYILNENENIEDRYSLYWAMMFRLSDLNFDRNNLVKGIYKKIYEDSRKKFVLDTTLEGTENRLYIFINQYLPDTNHAPSIILERIYPSLKKHVDEVYLIASTPYIFPYPLEEMKYFDSTIEENKIFSLGDNTHFIDFRGYITDSLYYQFMQEQNLSKKDKFLLIGHSNIHFDIIKSNRKIMFPTSTYTFEFSTANYLLFNEHKDFTNINDIKMDLIYSSGDYTKNIKYDFIPKDVEFDNQINIAIVGNRLDEELDEKFFLGIVEVINIIPNLKFHIVGLFSDMNKIPEEIRTNFVFDGYQNDLGLYYRDKIHFYLNPDRNGGGHSSIIAIKLGIPVISFINGDVMKVMNKKYWVDDYVGISNFIKSYCLDSEFKEEIDKKNQELVVTFEETFTNVMKEIEKV